MINWTKTVSTGPQEGMVKTSVFEKISYGMGDVACNVVFALTSGLVVYFYTNVMGISAGLVGLIMLFSRVFDGVSDVAIGLIVDKVNSKHGKGRVWVLWMAIPYGVTAIALFCLPAGATEVVQAIYIFITYNLCTTVVYTALNLPYASMAPLMTRDQQDLSVINIFRMSMSPIGNMIVSACTLPFIRMMGNDQAAWVKVTAIYAVIALCMLLWCFFGTKERVHSQAAKEAESMPLLTRLKALVLNKYFVLLIVVKCFLALYQNVTGTCATYYSQYILGNVELYGILNMAENIPAIIIMIMAPFIKRFGKRNLVLAGSIIIIIAQALLLFAPTSTPLAITAALLRGVGRAPYFACIFTMTADIVNYGHWKTGVRVQALIFSAVTAGQKFGGGVAGWLVGTLMEWSGFTGAAVEIPSAVALIQNMYIWGVIIAWGVIGFLMYLYKLDKQYGQIMKDLETRGV